MKTCNVRAWGKIVKAYYEQENNLVRVWDDIAGHYVACHSLTSNQIKMVIRKTK